MMKKDTQYGNGKLVKAGPAGGLRRQSVMHERAIRQLDAPRASCQFKHNGLMGNLWLFVCHI